LKSLAGWVGDIFVVDSGSTDNTVKIAQELGAKVFFHQFETHSQQWRWALQNLPISTEWVICLDADQRVTPELGRELALLLSKNRDSYLFLQRGEGMEQRAKGIAQGIRERILRFIEIYGDSWRLEDREQIAEGIEGIYVRRRQVFRGKWIKYGGYYPKYLLKVFKKDKVILDPCDYVDHHFYVSGRSWKLNSDIVEENFKENNLSFWKEKHRRYAVSLAREELERRRKGWLITPRLSGTPDERTAWCKSFWYHLPLFIRPFLYFFYRYFVRAGFLDGWQGLIFHFYQGFWYRFLVDIEVWKQRGLVNWLIS
jgi:glycosyltransferase involved in cell wall biosynthesis